MSQLTKELEVYLNDEDATKLSISINSLFRKEEQNKLRIIKQGLTNMPNLNEFEIKIKSNTILQTSDYQYIKDILDSIKSLRKITIIIEELCFLKDQGLLLFQQAIQNQSILSELKIVVEGHNYLQQIQVKHLIDSVKNLINLTVLKLKTSEESNSSGEGRNMWKSLSSLSKLQELTLHINLSNNDIQDITDICDSLVELKNLHTLNILLDQNNGRFYIAIQLLNTISQLIQLKKLKINCSDSAKLNRGDLEKLAIFFSNLKGLEVLDLKSIQDFFRKDVLEKYLYSLGQLVNLKKINLIIHDKMVQKQLLLGTCLKMFPKLEILRLKIFNNVYYENEGIVIISEAISQMKNIQKLSFLFLGQMSIAAYRHLGLVLKNLSKLSICKIKMPLCLLLFSESQISSQDYQLFTEQTSLNFSQYCLDDEIFTETKQKYLKQLINLNKFQFKFRMDFPIELTLLCENFLPLQKLTDLKLDITISKIDKNSCHSFVKSFQNLINLRKLNLEIQLGEKIKYQNIMFNGLHKLKNLTELILSINWPITVNKLKQNLSALKNLNYLKLKLTDPNTNELIDLFRSLKRTHAPYQNKRSNNYSQDQLCEQLSAVEVNHKYLVIGEDQIQRYGNDSKLIGQNKLFNILIELDLIFISPFTDQNAKQLSTSFLSLQNLQLLKIKFETKTKLFTKAGVDDLCQGFSYLKQLRTIGGEISSDLSETLKCLQSLSKLKQLNQNLLNIQINQVLDSDDDYEDNSFNSQENDDINNSVNDEDNQIDGDSEDSSIVSENDGNENNLNEDFQQQNNIRIEFEEQNDKIINTDSLEPLAKAYVQGIENQIQNEQNSLSDYQYQQPQQNDKNIKEQIPIKELNQQNIINEENELLQNQVTKLVYHSYIQNDETIIEELSSYFEQINNHTYLNSLNLQLIFDINGKEKINKMVKILGNSLKLLQNLEVIEIKLLGLELDYCSYQDLQNGLRYLQNLKQLRQNIVLCELEEQNELFSLLQYLKNLQILEFTNKNLSFINQQGVASLANSISQLSQLQELSLPFEKNCKIGQEGAIKIGQGLSKLKLLKLLVLQINGKVGINLEGALSIAHGISNLDMLYQLNLIIDINNNIQSAGGKALVQSLDLLENLTILSLQIKEGNQQDQQIVDQIFDTLNKRKNVEEFNINISLQTNSFKYPYQQSSIFYSDNEGETMELVFPFVFDYKKLMVQMSLQRRNISFKCDMIYSHYISSSIQTLSSFPDSTPLKITFNKNFLYEDVIDSQINEQIQQLKTKNLTIQFSSKVFIGKNILKFIEPLPSLRQLEHLSIQIQQYNNITSDICTHLAQYLSKLTQLSSLEFYLHQFNNVQQGDLVWIAQSLKNLDKLIKVVFVVNSVTVNRHLYKIKRLVVLDN